MYWQNTFADTPIKSITPKQVKKAIKSFASAKAFTTDGTGDKSNKTRSSNTVIRYKVVLSAIFKYAIREDYLKENPVDSVYVEATPNKIERYLSDEERIKLEATYKNAIKCGVTSLKFLDPSDFKKIEPNIE